MSYKKFTYEYVFKFFKEQGCLLLEEKYINSTTKVKYKCSCGNISNITFSNFREGIRCKLCGFKRRVENRKLDFNKIKSYFKKYNCVLLEDKYVNIHKKMKYKCSCGDIVYTNWYNFSRSKNHKCKKCLKKSKRNFEYVFNFFKRRKCLLLEKEYINTTTKMKYQCSCGNISYTTFSVFKSGHRCKKCGGVRIGNLLKYNYSYIKNFFKKEGCQLLSRVYTNSNIPLKYRCSCGNVSHVSFNHFMRGNRCVKCATKKTASKLRHSYEYVKDYFNKQGCTLLSKVYKNSNKKLRYKCKCGNISYIAFSSFLKGKRCKNCKSSNGEKKISKILTSNNISFETQKTFKGCKHIRILHFDFYIPKRNTCIEFDGQFHFEPKFQRNDQYLSQNYRTQKIRDKIKDDFCKRNNIKLLRIPYWKLNNIEDIIKKEVL
jgi:hypothetical protein